ncbi:DUF7239 family protein [Puerhibacterium puerhi]|uniref:DUF7239 family protein n=1 Tax=Puerhibacterium puerhi TaxID=2692623 RepID=UPI0013593BFD|nr:hypothetical protein [Puerhibacterium puerhi]
MTPKMHLRNPRLMFIEEPSDEGGSGPKDDTPPADESKPKEDGTPTPKDEDKGGNKEDDLPAWARDELSRTRREAARYRTERNDLRDKLKDAKTPEEFQAAVDEYNQKVSELELSLTREKVARKFNLPDELAERLKGSTEEELASDAEILKQFARPARGGGSDPKGGLDPTDTPSTEDIDDLVEDVYRASSW